MKHRDYTASCGNGYREKDDQCWLATNRIGSMFDNRPGTVTAHMKSRIKSEQHKSIEQSTLLCFN